MAEATEVVDTNWGSVAPDVPGGAPEEDPFEALPIVDSGTGPVVALDESPLTARTGRARSTRSTRRRSRRCRQTTAP